MHSCFYDETIIQDIKLYIHVNYLQSCMTYKNYMLVNKAECSENY